MKCSLQFLALLVVRTVVAAPSPGLEQVELGLSQAVERAVAPLAGHAVLPASGVVHAIEELTVENAIKEIHVTFMPTDGNLRPLFNTPQFRKILENNDNAAAIYDTFKRAYGDLPYYEQHPLPQFMQDLKALAFNHYLPGKIESVSEIMAYGKARQEIVDLLVKSDAFVKITNDLPALSKLLKRIRKDQRLSNSHGTVWDKHVAGLKEKHNDLWAKGAQSDSEITGNGKFLAHLNDWKNSRSVSLKLKVANVPPQILEVVKKAADKSFLEHLSHVKDYDGIEEVVKEFRDVDTLRLLENSKIYQEIINDPFKAFQLKASVRSREFEKTPFFENLLLASKRSYENPREVLATLKTIKMTPNDRPLNRFEPYIKFISDPTRAMKLLKSVKGDPASYTTFLSDEYLVRTLQAAAYKHLFPPSGDITAADLAKSYKSLVKVGVGREFQYDDNYLRFLRKGVDAKVAVLEEMKKIGITRDDPTFLDLERGAIMDSIFDMTDSQAVKGNEFLEELLLHKDGAKKVYDQAIRRYGGQSVMNLFNADFASRLKNIATA